MAIVQKITPCLWFDKSAEEAANFYVSIFGNSGIETITRYGRQGFERHGMPEGTVQTVTFRLEGQRFTALNGGPRYTLSPAVSFLVHCESQAEVDHFWNKLGEGGDPTWQVVPQALLSMIADNDAAKVGRVMAALMQMKKLDLATLQRAYDAG